MVKTNPRIALRAGAACKIAILMYATALIYCLLRILAEAAVKPPPHSTIVSDRLAKKLLQLHGERTELNEDKTALLRSRVK